MFPSIGNIRRGFLFPVRSDLHYLDFDVMTVPNTTLRWMLVNMRMRVMMIMIQLA